jgi:hypothetical protein
MEKWLLGGVTALLGVIGLFVAARAGTDSAVGYYGGLLFFALAVALVLYLIKQSYDRAHRH